MSRTRVAHHRCQVVDQRRRRGTGALGDAANRAGVRPGDDQMVDVAGCDRHLRQRVGERCSRQGPVDRLAEALLPHPGGEVAGVAPTVEYFGGGGGPPEVLGDEVAAGGAQQGNSTVATVALVGASRKTGADVGEHGEGGLGCLHGRAQGTDAGADRANHVGGEHVLVESEGRMDHRGVGLVEVGRPSGGEVQSPRRDLVGCGRQGSPRRLDTHARRVLVEGGDRSSSLAGWCAQGGRELGSLEAEVGQVGAVGDDAAHWSFPRMMPLVGTPTPEVTSTCSTSGTWLIAVPRTWRTPSAIPLMPWM